LHFADALIDFFDGKSAALRFELLFDSREAAKQQL